MLLKDSTVIVRGLADLRIRGQNFEMNESLNVRNPDEQR